MNRKHLVPDRMHIPTLAVPRLLASGLAALLVVATGCSGTEVPGPRVPSAPSAPAQTVQRLFTNGGFEDNHLEPWAPYPQKNMGLGTLSPERITDLQLQEGGVLRTYARTAANGPETEIPAGLSAAADLRWPKFGHSAAVVNELGKSYNANRLLQSATVGPSDMDPADGKVHVRFAFAPVLQNPFQDHTEKEQPYFYIELRNASRDHAVLLHDFHYANQQGIPWKTLKVDGEDVLYTDWQSVDVAPGDAKLSVGDTIELEVVAAGCAKSGHWGEVYVDGFGAFLPGLSIVASAPQAANADTDLTYTYLVKNAGATPTEHTLATIVLPAQTTYVSVSDASCTRTTTAQADTLTCDLGTLNPTASTRFQVTVHINSGATGVIAHGDYRVAATGVSQLIGPLVKTTVTAGIAYADLGVTLTDGLVGVGWNDPVRYTLVVTNQGPAAAQGASIDDDFPAQLTNISWTCVGSGGASCPQSSGTQNIHQLADLPLGGQLTFTVDATVVTGTGSGVLTHRASATAPSSSPDNNTTNDIAVDIDGIGTLYTLTVNKDPTSTGAGTIISSPAAISCDAACASANARFLAGSQVSLTATAAPFSTFMGWSGACASSQNPCVIDMRAATSVAALFTLDTYPITSSILGGNGTLTCPSSVGHGLSATCTLTPDPGYVVATLTDNGADVVGSMSGSGYPLSHVTQAHELVATFKKNYGTSCGGDSECIGNLCADGVCCNSACDGQCEACDVVGSVGTCVPVTGAPRGDRPACGSDGSECGKTCDGTQRDFCTFPSAQTSCGMASCSEGVATTEGFCDGAGACIPQTQTCQLYTCGETACRTMCTSDSECSAEATCLGGECRPRSDRTLWMVEGSGCSSTGAGGPLGWSLALGVLAVLARRRRGVGAVLSAAAVLSVPAAARADNDPVNRSFMVERFQPQPGQADVLGVQSARTGENLSFSARLFTSYAHQPLRLVSPADAHFQRLMIGSQSQFTLTASMAFQDRFEVGLAVPVLLHQTAESVGIVDPRLDGSLSRTALEDLRISAKASLLRDESHGLAVSLPISLPTAPGDSFVGGSGLTLNPTVIGELAGPRGSQWMANVGLLVGRSRQFLNLDLGTALTYGVGGKVDLVPRWNLAFMTTLGGEVGLAHPTVETSPLELLLGLRWGFFRNLEMTVGAGPGLTNGFGTPRYRALAALSYVPGSRPAQVAPAPIAPWVAPPVEPAPAPVEPAPAPAAPAPAPPLTVEEPPAPPPPAAVVVDNGKIRVLEKVNFATNKDQVLPESLHVLDDVFQLMSSDSSIHKVRIEAHTDNRGRPSYNKDLSDRRAKWVREYLIQKGLDSSRLDSSGFGQTRPITTNDTEEGRANNRRVEFVVTE